MSQTRDQLREFAKVGAAIRLAQLRLEMAQIYKAFPSLRFQKRVDQGGASAVSSKVTRRRKRRALTAAEKKAISTRMKKLWAERKAKS
jgi:hypothetical protein